MSTFPFVQVQGALALPHIRPLARLPVSFGREWALTPPHSSLRAELRALYAAILRTVRLSAEAFRAAARWDTCHIPAPQSHRPVAAPIGSQTDCWPTASRAAYAVSSPPASLGQKPPVEQHRLAGGAVAIGGAALLAWIVASHAPHEAATETGSANARPVPVTHQDASHHLAEARAQHEPLVTGPVRQAALPPSLPARPCRARRTQRPSKRPRRQWRTNRLPSLRLRRRHRFTGPKQQPAAGLRKPTCLRARNPISVCARTRKPLLPRD